MNCSNLNTKANQVQMMHKVASAKIITTIRFEYLFNNILLLKKYLKIFFSYTET